MAIVSKETRSVSMHTVFTPGEEPVLVVEEQAIRDLMVERDQ